MNICIIGAGASGLMAAYHASTIGHQVTIIEKNDKIGKKLFITGKGRCNITNNSDAENVIKNVVRNPKFLYSALYSYDSYSVMDFFESQGLKLKTERGNRVFPYSDHSSDVVNVFSKIIKENNINLLLNKCAVEIIINDNNVSGVLLSTGEIIACDRVIVCTGGSSYPLTGSTGDGYKLASKLGHTITAVQPSLVPLTSDEEWIYSLMGLSLKNVTVKLLADNKLIYSELGEMMFTHFGLTGPLILSASAYYVDAIEKNKTVRFAIDFKPGLTHEMLDKRILRDFETNMNKQFSNALDDLLPKRLIPVIVSRSIIFPDKKVNEITKEERLHLVNLFKNFEINITGTRPIEEAIITKGGINVKEVNSSTMESKIVKGLFFAGEVLDLDAFTGGYNLQIAWSTGYLAAMNLE